MERENNKNKYVSHEITKTMFENNENFYETIVRKNFDIKLFERSFRKRKWSPRQVVGFLAFGRIMDRGYDVDVVINLMEKWVPNWKAQFWWLVFSEHVKFFNSFKVKNS